MNKCTGVVGVFNCQGAGWDKVTKKTLIHDPSPGALTTSVSATDVDAIAQVAGSCWNGETVVYAQKSGNLCSTCWHGWHGNFKGFAFRQLMEGKSPNNKP